MKNCCSSHCFVHSLVPEIFEIHPCPKYFGYKRYALFRQDLDEHGFQHIRSGRDRNGTLLHSVG